MSNEENNPQDTQPTEKKKLSLQEAMQQMLANKKAGQAGKGGSGSIVTNTSRQSQATKKVSNQRRKTGGS